jgi:preprotein translocase subunit SecB
MADAAPIAPATDGTAATQPLFNIERIYLKDLSVENPGAPQSFVNASNQGPNVEVGLQLETRGIQEGYFDVVVALTVTAKLGESVLFLVEAKQAGIFQVRGVPETDLPPLLAIHCPNIIFPYVRETVSDAINRMGFPPVYLQPINFEALYQQQLDAELARLDQATATKQ